MRLARPRSPTRASSPRFSSSPACSRVLHQRPRHVVRRGAGVEHRARQPFGRVALHEPPLRGSPDPLVPPAVRDQPLHRRPTRDAGVRVGGARVHVCGHPVQGALLDRRADRDRGRLLRHVRVRRHQPVVQRRDAAARARTRLPRTSQADLGSGRCPARAAGVDEHGRRCTRRRAFDRAIGWCAWSERASRHTSRWWGKPLVAAAAGIVSAGIAAVTCVPPSDYHSFALGIPNAPLSSFSPDRFQVSLAGPWRGLFPVPAGVGRWNTTCSTSCRSPQPCRPSWVLRSSVRSAGRFARIPSPFGSGCSVRLATSCSRTSSCCPTGPTTPANSSCCSCCVAGGRSCTERGSNASPSR